jgi:antitoxin (DNA-binding transcriptional repressor) of toxin-antitoxin stability system
MKLLEATMKRMRAVGLKVLKNKLSEYVRLAQNGETILVTDRERVVAELVPPREGRSPAVADAVLAQLVREGWLTPAARPFAEAPPNVPLVKLSQILRELDEDREDR